MTELEQVLAGDSAHTPPAAILESLKSEAAHQIVATAPHSIYEELWHIAYWQQVTLDWVRGVETPLPGHTSAGFPSAEDKGRESWDELRERFFEASRRAVFIAQDLTQLDTAIRCPARPGRPTRIMSIRDQLESLGAHNAYHFGRIVLLRQLMGLWPPPSGGYTW